MSSKGPRAVAVLVVAAVVAGHVVTACRQPHLHFDPSERYFLEVANDAADRVRVRISMGSSDFLDRPSGQKSPFWIELELENGERTTLRMAASAGGETAARNILALLYFGEIHFLEANSSVAYRSYVYRYAGCEGDDRKCWESGDDTLIYHRRSDGTTERLVVESPERPFYLERDKNDPDLGRIVITFVPGATEGSGSTVE